MIARRLLCLCALALSLLSHAPFAGAADDVGTSASSGLVLGGDVILRNARGSVLAMGGSVIVADGAIANAAIAAGTVHMTGGKVENLAVTGGTVTFDGGSLGDVVAAAGTLKVNALISGDLHAAGGTIVTTRDAVIGGDARLSGGEVTVDGTVKNSLRIRAGHISIAGTIGGTVYVFGDDITVAPGTRIGGDLVYAAPEELSLPPDVTIGGKVIRRSHDTGEHAPEGDSLRHVVHTILSIGFAGLLLCGLIIIAAMPTLLAPASDAFRLAFGRSLFIGFVAACALPVAATVLAVTVIGIPLALLLLAAGGAFTGVGLAVACRWAGDRIRTRFGRPAPTGTAQEIGWGLAGFVVFALVGVVPALGAMAQGIAILGGTGAALGALWSRRPTRVASG